MFLLCVGCTKSPTTPIDISQANFVGSASCIECHRNQVDSHAGSHHALAMQPANDKTVLADFSDVQVEHHGIRSRMFRDGERFMVHTEGPDGLMHDYQVTYVFGLTPLQQYMVEFPSPNPIANQATESTNNSASKSDTTSVSVIAGPSLPRIQVLPVCWDTKAKRWFQLDPPDVKDKLDPHDDLHWSGIGQRWNNMCAECHSTNYQKNFTPATFGKLSDHSPSTVNQADSKIGEYRSTFSEINVACEACHGPASVHVQLAKQKSPGWNRERGYGVANLKASAEAQIQSCAPCHARRGLVFPDFKAGDNYYDHYQENLLTWPIYYPDGQVLDEDYIHGSFLQSKMYHKGIRCTDCHDPHTAKLKQQGNQVCTSCHQHPAAKYDSPAHHFHKVDSEGAKCVNCHMPPTTYMEVDARHDHSLRIPRPDMSLKMETPNACTSCHLKLENVAEEKRPKLKLYQHWMQAARDGDAEVAAEVDRANHWCNEACNKWYGEKRRREDHWGMAIYAAQHQQPDAADRIAQLLKSRGEAAPAIARATALQMLSELSPQAAGQEAVLNVDDPHPLVRTSVANALAGNADQARAVSLLEKLLKDPVRTVRLAAAQQILSMPANLRSPNGQVSLRNTLGELEKGLAFSNDRAGSHMSLGNIAEQQGMDREAIKHYETAIVVEPAMAGPRTNLAALLNRNLSSASSMPAELRAKMETQIKELREDELVLLDRDIRLLPNPPASLIFRFGLSLYLAGREREAVAHFVRAAELDPTVADYTNTAAELYEKLRDYPQAQYWAQQTLKRFPGHPDSQAVLQRIEKATQEGNP